ncbi:MAG: hypothetical protein IJT24_03715 [Lachnospiraceae bacterium]|nr:hypothetical protein [Lachnospiraceae bacterium]
MIRYSKKRTAFVMAFITAAALILPDAAYAGPVDSLKILAGEALAVQGDRVSHSVSSLDPDKLSMDELTVENFTVSSDALSGNTVVYIDSADDLVELAEKADIDSYTRDRTYILTKDIDLMGKGFTSVPVFSGVFEGKGHSIRGFTYNGMGYVTGLFRYVSQGAIVQNLNVYGNVSAVNDEEITGGICGVNEGVISNCSFRGILKGRAITGGIAAINEVPGTIMACTNEAQISGYYYTGGVTGKNYGVTAYSYNKGPVNTTAEWVEGSDAYDPGQNLISAFLNGSVDREDDTRIRTSAGVDTGGIAGYSRGAIYECTNKADVGYEHTGYNVGGVAGRQAGFVSFCSNEGTIYGRKDVGGIVGHMEPHLTLSDLETLPEAVDKLHDLVDVSIDDMHESVGMLSGDVRQLSAYADSAVEAGDALGTSAENYLNSVSDAANSLQSRVDYLSEKMPKLIDYLSEANDDISDTAHDLSKLLDDANVHKRISSSEEKSASLNEAKKRATASDNTLKDRLEATEEMISIIIPETVDAAKSVSGNTKRLRKSMDEMSDDLGDGLDYTNDVVKKLNSMSKPTAPYLGSDFDAARSSLADDLSGMSKVLSVLADHSNISSGKVSEDLSEVNDQISVVFHIISDQLERLGDISNGSSDEIVTDVSGEEIDRIEQGRVDHSENIGSVEGDINIGGIAGSMSIDTEDPEENAAGDMTGGFTSKYLLRNIILDCRSDSNVKGKKDGAGGIVGYMEHGIVKGCESYGYVESTEGGYVGGIAGQSLSVIKDSYAMSFIAGDSYTGGIAGFGTTINGCTAFPVFEKGSDRQGSIAGQIDTDRETHLKHIEAISGNRFINEYVAGIDGLSVKDRAEPVSYGMVVSDPQAPGDFKNIRVVFKVGDEKPSQVSVPYGTRIADIAFPQTMPMAGQYVEWEEPDMNSRITEPYIINGELKNMEKTLVSSTLYPGTDQPAALVSGSFTDTDVLSASVTEGDMETEYTISYEADHPDPLEALRLYNPFDKAAVYGVSDDGAEHKLDGNKKGSYIEIRGEPGYYRYRIKNTALIDRIKAYFGMSGKDK